MINIIFGMMSLQVVAETGVIKTALFSGASIGMIGFILVAFAIAHAMKDDQEK